MTSNAPIEPGSPGDPGTGLDELFRGYREACADPEASADFMPNMWARIEAREVSANWFGRVAKALVTAGIAVSAVLGMMISSANRSSNTFFDATFVEALQADNASNPDPLHLDRIVEFGSYP